jgi:hypothetical protein
MPMPPRDRIIMTESQENIVIEPHELVGIGLQKSSLTTNLIRCRRTLGTVLIADAEASAPAAIRPFSHFSPGCRIRVDGPESRPGRIATPRPLMSRSAGVISSTPPIASQTCGAPSAPTDANIEVIDAEGRARDA